MSGMASTDTMVVGKPTATVPDSALAPSLTCCFSCSICRRIARLRAYSAWPAAVGVTPR